MSWTKEVRRQKLRETNYRCQVCNNSFEEKPRQLVLHHIVNRSHGGTDAPSNAEVRCKACETKMHILFPHDGNMHDGVMASSLA